MKASQCEIWVQGDVGDDLMEALPQFTAIARGTRTTMLRGQLRDQAELHGVLKVLDQLGVELVEVRTTE
ncbi:MAG: hypothetical protein ABWX74_03750 [Aeromicrobium sp.]